jgi:hypothetical protein
LQQQIALNLEALAQMTGRSFSEAERQEMSDKTLHAWRWTFLVSGLEHPRVVTLVTDITEAGPAKFRQAAEALSA